MTAVIAARQTFDMKFEVAVIPVSDIDRSKRFYEDLGWRLDADFIRSDESRAVQLTPPGSPSSIQLGSGPAALEAARAEFLARGVDVSEIFHRGIGKDSRLSGPDPERRSYASFVTFDDPDGNNWLVQEVTQRLPGRVSADQRPSPHQQTLRQHCDAPRPRMANTRSGPVSATRNGPTGTPSTS
jgi:catechol 2,3-dioxygenase-like lactoylglutathione lyase family enzyme